MKDWKITKANHLVHIPCRDRIAYKNEDGWYCHTCKERPSYQVVFCAELCFCKPGHPGLGDMLLERYTRDFIKDLETLKTPTYAFLKKEEKFTVAGKGAYFHIKKSS